ncbi:MAG: inosine 5-monophosphate dehydrogenase [Omnitrophica bacterium RIFCSPHIGHO2_02_FULL_49_9]|nr:MAG: inosine 5-monophosphate dehydrogenase [Omnitrophica bacterium RIFCSPHIGHO2_02_FULL_49_9]OGW88946.1 MAG: inosine 5-monophosphate dehydrogenase [Omnitrophica bacterium RIFCSPLOWO2_01_FULL_50_24]
MGEWIGIGRKARRAYGFDEIALVPGTVTVNPEEVDIGFTIDGTLFPIPFLASAMDGVVDPHFAIKMGKLGGIAVLNLEGLYTRYEDYSSILEDISRVSSVQATELVQKLYTQPIKEDLVSKRVQQIKQGGVPAVVSTIPQHAERFGAIAQEAGCDIFVIQSTVTTVRHLAKTYKAVDLEGICKRMNVPVIIGNSVTYDVAIELMGIGAHGLLIGIGPGSACTTRGVLGLGVPQVTSICDSMAAREAYFKKSKRYVPIIADGGMSTGGDVCKAFACGADAVMIGSAFARAKEAPGRGFHWGMATPHANLPRGTRIHVGTTGSLGEILFGPARLDDGTQNLVGAVRTCMGNVGAKTIKEFQKTEIIIAPAIRTEGKLFQAAQHVGMMK